MKIQAVMLGLLLAVTPCLAQKVTVDPNLSGTKRAAASDKALPYNYAKDPDKRMARNVSYAATHVRLSRVVAELSKQTGVAIACGKNQNDWRSRDVPVTVYAKDLPLGVLLRALARGTHNILKVHQADSVRTYRICQADRLAGQLSGFFAAREDYCSTINGWNWDAAVSLREVPDAEFGRFHNDAVVNGERIKLVRCLSELLSGLGAEYRQRVVDGERLTLDISNIPAKTRELFIAAMLSSDQVWQAYSRSNAASNGDAQPATLPREQMDCGRIVIYGPQADAAEPYSQLEVEVALPGRSAVSQDVSPYRVLTGEAARKRFGPPPPLSTPIEDERDWDLDYRDPLDKSEALRKKIDVSDLGKTEEMDMAEVYAAIAERAGYSIVIEDWWFLRGGYSASNYEWRFISASDTWQSKLKSQDLKSFQPSKALKAWGHYSFHIDSDSKVLIGIDKEWSLRRLGLIPASLRDSTIAKLNGEGVDVDDIAPLLALTPIQWQESVKASKDLCAVLQHADTPYNPLWRFYAGLSASEKAAAKSAEGLPLGQYNRDHVSHLLRQACQASQTDYRASPDLHEPARLALHLKPIPKAVLHMISSYAGPLIDYSGLGRSLIGEKPVHGPVPGLTSYSSYQLSVRTIEKPTSSIMSTVWVRELPFYSDKRARQLAKQATDPRN